MYVDYFYKLSPDSVFQKNKQDYCYMQLRQSMRMNAKNSLEVKINMFKLPHPQYGGHSFVFEKEDVLYVFEKLNCVVDVPLIEDYKSDKYGDGISVIFEFKDKSFAYINTIITICRYFFEHCGKELSEMKDFTDIMREAVDYSKSNPEYSFIEILQLAHSHNNLNWNHSIIYNCRNGNVTTIVSENTFVSRMNDSTINYIYEYRSDIDSIFNGVGIVQSAKKSIDTLFKEAIRV